MTPVDSVHQLNRARHFTWKDRPEEIVLGTITRKFVTSERIMIGEVRFKKGDQVPVHSHPNEQFTHVVQGRLRFFVADAEIDVSAGELIFIPSGVDHSVHALEDTLEYDVFTPPRSDWIAQDSNFFSKGPARRL
ncbi:cupin domain-containing protein [Sphingobium subterraneum]|uniref:Quercetin dioxygenase-like cupin family protein n=1 Tax=Sphingobium subterraneum TaxID=627688 RepID=A0A841IYD5_9SPHN|nr:cupin domain-containing protein [Sphingobium subterraneum]MBB6122296.1 quercetin dioxygenase-like cupin family protein [Sphingobium subterraneum]